MLQATRIYAYKLYDSRSLAQRRKIIKYNLT
jgi:hypothetical protein